MPRYPAAVPYYICPRCKERSVDIDAREGFSQHAPACRHCGFGFLFELLDDYYPAPETGFLVTDQERRVLAIGRGVFELTGFRGELGRGRRRSAAALGREAVELAREWGVRRLGEKLSIRRAPGWRSRRADVFPAYDDDGGLLVASRPTPLAGTGSAREGQSSQRGGGRRRRRPCQIRRCGNRAQSSRGTSRIRSRSILTGSSWRSPRRCESRRTWVSTTIPCASPRSAETTFAVFRATPGSRSSSSNRRHLAVELVDEPLHGAAQRLRLLPEEARGEDVALELLPGTAR